MSKLANILVADTPLGAKSILRIMYGHECTVVSTMAAALAKLKIETFDLIIASLHFDESQMFELIREVRMCTRNSNKPIICFCSRETPMSRIMHESIECTTHALGAWMYLDEHAYNVYQDPSAELRRVMERCLTDESRKELLEQRGDIQRQRAELHHLRTLLQAQDWSPGLKGYLIGLKLELEGLLKEVTVLQSAAGAGRASVSASRDLKDRVAERVTVLENGITSAEEFQTAAEHGQTVEEERLTKDELTREAEARRKQECST